MFIQFIFKIEYNVCNATLYVDPTSPFSSNDLWRVCLPQSSGIKFSTGMDESRYLVIA